CHQHVNSPLSF
nr:immunoglobulin light chain junction region [Macaca mulatta]MOX89463.1 immunoglobulin light chain junction region [Macaca mulatta]